MYVHFGHNTGWDPICNNEGKAEDTLFHGQGIRHGMKWCKECQRILQSIHGPDTYLNMQLELPGMEE